MTRSPIAVAVAGFFARIDMTRQLARAAAADRSLATIEEHGALDDEEASTFLTVLMTFKAIAGCA
jgi:hypothetical protein